MAAGRMIHSACSITRRCKISGVSPGCTSTAFCFRMHEDAGGLLVGVTAVFQFQFGHGIVLPLILRRKQRRTC